MGRYCVEIDDTGEERIFYEDDGERKPVERHNQDRRSQFVLFYRMVNSFNRNIGDKTDRTSFSITDEEIDTYMVMMALTK